MKVKVEPEQKKDGRWIAEVIELAGVMTHCKSRQQPLAGAEALLLRPIADCLKHGPLEEREVTASSKLEVSDLINDACC